MEFKLAQMLCPKRHCIFAVLAQGQDEAIVEGLRNQVQERLQAKTLRPWCALCGAKEPTWHTEIGIMKAKTYDDALDELAQCAIDQAITRKHLMATGQAYDSPLRN